MKRYFIVNLIEDNESYYIWIYTSKTITIYHNESFKTHERAFKSFKFHVKRLTNYDLGLHDIKSVIIGKFHKTFADFLDYQKIKWDLHFNRHLGGVR